jgi:hypothetical protein
MTRLAILGEKPTVRLHALISLRAILNYDLCATLFAFRISLAARRSPINSL